MHDHLNRRRFLGAVMGTGAAAATAGAWAPGAGAHSDGWRGRGARGGRVPGNRVGIQLYSLRRVMTDGPSARRMFSQLARMGYTEVEPFGDSYGWTAKQFRAELDRVGLRAVSRHDNLDLAPGSAWKEPYKKTLEDAKTLGQSFTGVAWHPGPYTEERYKQLAERFSEAGAMAKAAGLQFFYHNHDFDFASKQSNGKPVYDILLQTDASLVKFELDLYWIVVGGESPIDYLSSDPSRWPLYHVKDKTWKDRPNEQDWEDVGPGSLDFPDIFTAGARRGVDKHFIVEHDWPPLSHPNDPDAELKTSRSGVEYLRNVRW
jgi:sugar phosphate isomerase/epimerase